MIGLEGVAALQLAPQRRMIDDLAVEDDRVALIGAEDRLVAAFDVDDAEAAHAEAEIALDKIAGVVGAAVHQPVAGGAIASCGTGLPPRRYHPAIPHMRRLLHNFAPVAKAWAMHDNTRHSPRLGAAWTASGG